MRSPTPWRADEAPHHRDIPLRDIVGVLLELRPAGMTITGANGRHAHEWKVWQDVKLPEGKVIVPGVIDSTTNIIEHPEAVAERIVRYASVLGRENIIAGGIAASTRWQTWGKSIPRSSGPLRSLSDGAALATKKLWGE